jgi:hypothetical protein
MRANKNQFQHLNNNWIELTGRNDNLEIVPSSADSNRIPVISFADPDPFGSNSFSRIRIRSRVFCPDPYRYPTLIMSPSKLSVRENLTTYARWSGNSGRTDEENQVKMYKKYRFSTLLLWNSKDPDPYQSEKSEPDPYQSEKSDLYQSEKQDLCQNGLDSQHCL